MEIKAVLFDLWDTLVYFDERGVKLSTEEIIEYLRFFNKNVSVEAYKEFRKKYHVDLTMGAVSPPEANRRFLAEFGIPSRVTNYLNVKVDESLRKNTRVYPGAFELLHDLRSRGIKLGLVSNCMDGTVNILEWIGLNQFDSYGLSNEVGARKPAPKIYLKVTGELSVKPEECVFVSDEISDLAGARNLGMKTIHLKGRQRTSLIAVVPDRGVIKPDASANSLNEVFAIVSKWVNEP
jgi:putative hydrolase of the HAD superfamily